MGLVQVELLFSLRQKDTFTSQMLAMLAREILAPLANQLGIGQLKWPLEDLSLRALEPDAYHTIANSLEEKRLDRQNRISRAIAEISDVLQKANITAEINGRPKHIDSIYRKMQHKQIPLSQLYDLHAIRIFVENESACYSALSLVQMLWKPIDGEFDDYIAKPKPNGYRSLHTAVIGPDDKALEVQIRTQQMHEESELGVASHWYYKESGSSASSGNEQTQRVALLRRLLSWQADSNDLSNNAAAQELVDDTIYVFTPEGKILDLPRGSTPLDFAYTLHTDLGHRCRGAKVDNYLVALNTALQNGQTVEILPTKNGAPSRDWLNPELHYLISTRARAKVKQWFSRAALDEWVARGREWLEDHLKEFKAAQTNLEELARALHFKNVEALLAGAGRNEITARALRQIVQKEDQSSTPQIGSYVMPINPALPSNSSILFVGVDRLLMNFAGCCKPVRPDRIIGFITRTKGITVHREDCANLIAMDKERLIPAAWSQQTNAEESFELTLQIEAIDHADLLRDLTETLAKEKITIRGVQMNTRQRVGQSMANLRLTIEIKHRDQLGPLLHQLQQVPQVESVRRV